MTRKNNQAQKKTTSPKEEAVLTRDEFFRVLNLVTRPVNVKAKPTKKEKKGT